MIIQFNTDKNLSIKAPFKETLSELLEKSLDRFSEQITRLEVHLSDENGSKTGTHDKRCLLEARLEGLQPIAVTADAQTHEQSLKAAIEKLKNTLDSQLGKLRNH